MTKTRKGILAALFCLGGMVGMAQAQSPDAAPVVTGGVDAAEGAGNPAGDPPAAPATEVAAPASPAAPPPRPANVYVRKVKAPLNQIYKRVFTSLENNGYFVIVEPNIGRNLAHFASRWGKDYNRNKLEGIRSMVFCNGWYANQVSNADPDMLALCPLHITLVHKAGETRILFVRPSQVAFDSPARAVALELEQDVIRTIEEGLPR